MVAPLAFMAVLDPSHIVGALADAVKAKLAATVIVIVVVLVHPLPLVPVKVYVFVVVGLTLILDVVDPVLQL